MKKLLFTLLFSLIVGVGMSQCGCTKLVFIVDNSGSVSTSEFTDMKRSIDTISAQLLRQYPGSEITVLQYASQNATNHTYAITVPFTTSTATAQTWSRAFGTGGTVLGVSRGLREYSPQTNIMICEPDNSQILSSGIAQKRDVQGDHTESHPNFRPHLMQGWSPDFIPKLAESALTENVIDGFVPVDGNQALQCSKNLAQKKRSNSDAY